MRSHSRGRGGERSGTRDRVNNQHDLCTLLPSSHLSAQRSPVLMDDCEQFRSFVPFGACGIVHDCGQCWCSLDSANYGYFTRQENGSGCGTLLTSSFSSESPVQDCDAGNVAGKSIAGKRPNINIQPVRCALFCLCVRSIDHSGQCALCCMDS